MNPESSASKPLTSTDKEVLLECQGSSLRQADDGATRRRCRGRVESRASASSGIVGLAAGSGRRQASTAVARSRGRRRRDPIGGAVSSSCGYRSVASAVVSVSFVLVVLSMDRSGVNAASPVATSYSVTPMPHTSAAADSGPPRACSGAW